MAVVVISFAANGRGGNWSKGGSFAQQKRGPQYNYQSAALKLQGQEGKIPEVVPLLPQIMRDLFPSRGDRPPRRVFFPPPCLDPDPPEVGILSFFKAEPMDPNLPRQEIGVSN